MDPVTLPSMWREELLHPFLAHLPIVLIPVAFAFRVGSMIFKKPLWNFLFPASRLLLVLAAIGAWIALYTGGIAEDIVNRVICDPTVTHEHEDFAEWTTYLVSAAALFDLASLKTPSKVSRALLAISVLALAASFGLIAWTSHLGASLVYQQGAAVYRPTPECREFEGP